MFVNVPKHWTLYEGSIKFGKGKKVPSLLPDPPKQNKFGMELPIQAASTPYDTGRGDVGIGFSYLRFGTANDGTRPIALLSLPDSFEGASNLYC